jgi:hypothetical protein
MTNKQKLELSWIGKDEEPRLELSAFRFPLFLTTFGLKCFSLFL